MAAPAKKDQPSAYPFSGILEFETAKHTLTVFQMNSRGFMARIQPGIVHIGRIYICQFDFAESRVPLRFEAKVIRTFDRRVQNPDQTFGTERFVELFFTQVAPPDKKRLEEFIKQNGRR